MKKCIGINILDFDYTDDDEFYKSYHIREDKTNALFTDILEWHIIELTKLPPEAKDNNTGLYNWAKFLKSEKREELEMIAQKDPYINEAFKQLEIISQDKIKQIEYTSRQKALLDYNTIMEERYETGIQKGRQIGKQEGIQEGRQELLDELMALGMKIPNEILKKCKPKS